MANGYSGDKSVAEGFRVRQGSRAGDSDGAQRVQAHVGTLSLVFI